MQKNLFLFTSKYPFGNSESFIENEIEYLAQSFKKVFIVPISRDKNIREIPANCEVVDFDYSDEGYSKTIVLKCYPVLLYRLYRSELKANGSFQSAREALFSTCLREVFKAIKLEKLLADFNCNDAVFYTYWMDQWTTLLSILKAANKIPNLISRAHGFDLYIERRPEPYIPFRSFQMEHIDLVAVISKDGEKYLKKKYSAHNNKIVFNYLGTSDMGFNEILPGNRINMISLSNVVEVKRVKLIVEILKNMELPANWTHFGDGNLMDDLKEAIKQLPAHHSVELKGRQPNKVVLAFLKNNPIDFLINVSSSEGLPVSFMEAASFGIPVVATDVGGVKEIVNKTTGLLIDEKFDVKNIANIIQYEYLDKFNNVEFRSGIRSFWEKNFSANKNYTEFIERLK